MCPDGRYVAFAHPPGCGREHFAAVAEVYRKLLERWGQQERAPRITEALRLDATPAQPRRQHKPREPVPDGLKTAKQAAAKLGCSIKTLKGHVDTGALRYVPMGHGKKRLRRMYNDADLDEFIANQTRKDTPCPSIASRARHTGTSNSESKIIAFTAAPKPRPGAKPKR